MYRPGYKVVTGVVALLVLLAFFARIVEPAIPEPAENRLGKESGAYLKAGAKQKIDWRPLRSEAFTEARRRDMPILVVVGAPWSKFASDMDVGVFEDPSIQNFLARNFICVRVDSTESPEWRSAYFPFARAEAGTLMLPGFSAWALDSAGAMFDFYGRASGYQGAESAVFMSFLLQARERFDRLSPADIGSTRGGAVELEDKQEIDTAQQSLPDLAGHLHLLLDSADARYGGFPLGGIQILRPNAWRFLLLAGQVEAFRKTSDLALQSSIVDLRDGGFFVTSDTTDWRTIDVSKSATLNADMLRTLVLAEVLTGDPIYRWLAERTFDSLVGEFHKNDGIMAVRLSDAGPMGRSVHSSFSPRRLREVFPNIEDRSWAWNQLGLRTESNGQMLPRLTRLDLPFAERATFERVMGKLRESTAKQPDFAGSQLLNVNGFVVARLMEAARAWGDADRMAKAAELYGNIDRYRSVNDVVHTLLPEGMVQASLADYLGYADAALASYLSTGRIIDLDNGKEVLRRGLYLYRGGRLGVVRAGSPPPGVTATGCEVPEILDDIAESSTAQTIRLCNAYAALYLTGDPKASQELTAVASAATNLFPAMVRGLGASVSGYYCSAARVLDSAYVFTVGPNSVRFADALAARLPSRIIAPAIGPVRGDLQAKGPGVYIVRGASVDGPMTVEAALGKLSPVLELHLRTR